MLCNSLVYGRGLGLRQDSLQVPALISYALRCGVAPQIGMGASAWSTVHIGDLCRMYTRVVEDESARGFYFVETGEASFHDMAVAIADRFEPAGIRSLSLTRPPPNGPTTWPRFRLGPTVACEERGRGPNSGGPLGTPMDFSTGSGAAEKPLRLVQDSAQSRCVDGSIRRPVSAGR